MAIHDSDPERRNLVVMSLGFIIFYWGEGRMVSEQLALPLVNIEFENTTFLAGLAWVMLFWFAWRYWQTHLGMAREELNKELFDLADQELLERYVAKKTGLISGEKGGFNKVQRNPAESQPPSLRYTEITASGTRGVKVLVPFEGMSLLKMDFKLVVLTIIKRPGFTSYYVPYLLFYAAVLIGMWPFGFRYVG